MCDRLISVIIPVYNLEKYIGRCLNSVVTNTYDDLQIICVNDGSTDQSLDVLKKYAARDERIHIIDKSNGGLPSARNAGMDAATGDSICHIDGDDWVHTHFFEFLMQAWIESGEDADVVACKYLETNSFTVLEENCKFHGWSATGSAQELVTQHPDLLIHIWGRMFKRTLIGNFRQKLDIINGEDVLYNFCVLGKKDDIKVVTVAEPPLYYYYFRPDSITHLSTGRERWQIPMGVYENVNLIRSEVMKKYAYHFVLERTLISRYEGMFFDQKFPKTKPDYDMVIRNVLRILAQSNEIKFPEKVKIIIKWKMPRLYRLFRLMIDPTLFTWEKVEKEKVRKRTTSKTVW